MDASAADFVFNIVWTGTVFTHLRHLVNSQLAHSGARFRFLANGCPPAQVAAMEAFADRHADQVVEVYETSAKMVNHGVALDWALSERNDGDYFCFADADILARGRYLGDFAARLDGGCDAVTSGRGVWCDDDRVPPDHPGVAGEHFYSQTGYLFGSPHFAMYRRDPLVATMQRWGVTFASAGAELTDEARERLTSAGHNYIIFDTAKLVNIFLQEQGHRLCHFEHDNLVHIGGVSHYLAPTGTTRTDDGELEPNWKTWAGMTTRFEVAEYTATVIRALGAGRPAPPVPASIDATVRARLVPVRDALLQVMAHHRDPATIES